MFDVAAGRHQCGADRVGVCIHTHGYTTDFPARLRVCARLCACVCARVWHRLRKLQEIHLLNCCLPDPAAGSNVPPSSSALCL